MRAAQAPGGWAGSWLDTTLAFTSFTLLLMNSFGFSLVDKYLGAHGNNRHAQLKHLREAAGILQQLKTARAETTFKGTG